MTMPSRLFAVSFWAKRSSWWKKNYGGGEIGQPKKRGKIVEIEALSIFHQSAQVYVPTLELPERTLGKSRHGTEN